MTNRFEQSPELSPLKRALLALEQMQARLDAAERAKRAPIAIIGMGCRFPGADSIAEFWQLLHDGIEAVGEIPADRWDIDAYYDPNPNAPGKMSSRRGGFLRSVDQFDPQFFGIAPREALSMDPQQRLLLEVAWEALEHAAIAPDSLAGSRTGVFVGVTTGDYAQIQLNSAGLAGLDAYYASGVAHSIVSGRLSYVLGLQGPSITLDTACSSSLVAIHLAIQSLRSGECRSALAGGVNLILSPENSITLSKYHMLAPDGRCKTFDAAADGFVRGEGCGLIVLKRLSDALADGDRVLAVIRGSAVNQDGASSGLTAPNGPAQAAVIRDALTNGGIAAHEVGYVEAHGTGTALGDPIEVQALAASLGVGRSSDQPLLIGSVKTNIGHLESAAGVAGVIKVVLMLQHAQLLPHLHLHQPSPHIDWAAMPIAIPTTLAAWPQHTGRRIAGVSSFGFSGTNTHLLIEEAPISIASPATVTTVASPGLVALSAKSEPALRAIASRLATHLAAHPDLALADVCYTLNAGRAHFAHRIALPAETTSQLGEQLAAYAAGQMPQSLVSGYVASADPPKIAFLFTGQGAQYPGMAHTLYQAQPAFRAALDRCATLLQPHLDRPLLDLLFDAADPNDRTHPLHQTAYTQPALFAIEYALTELWRSWGITPQAVLGHSVGEYVAAVLAGVFSLEDGLRLIVARGRLMQALPVGGAMAAIFAPVDAVRAAVAPHTAVLDVAAINGPEHTVIAGTAQAVASVSAQFADTGVRVQPLVVSHAFHSPLIEPILAAFGEVASTIQYATPRLRLISNVTGKPAGREISEASYWVRHIRAAVQFADGINTLIQQGYTHYIEIGPHPTLLGMARLCAPPETGTWVPSLRRNRDDLQQIRESLAGLYANGVQIDWASYASSAAPQKIDLPTYPFQRQRYWVQARRPSATSANAPGDHPLLGHRLRSPLKMISYAGQIDAASLAYLGDHRVFASTILPATAFIEAALAAAPALGTGPATLTEMVIHEALVVAGDQVHALHTILDPAGNQATFEIYSQAAGAEDWKLHASGQLRIEHQVPSGTQQLAAIQSRCTTEVSTESHYALLAEHGLDFGPSLRGLRRLWVGVGEALGEVLLPAPQAAELGQYHIHPALLDPCIQVIADLSASDQDTYLPMSIERITCHTQPGSLVWAHGLLHGDLAARPETLRADIRLYSAAGDLLVEIVGLVLKRANRAALLRMSGQERPADWLYVPVWQPASTTDANVQESVASFIPAATTISTQASEQITSLRADHKIEHYQHMLNALEALSSDYTVLALARLGQPLRIGTHFRAADLHVLDRHRALLGRLLAILAEDGLIQPDGDGWRVMHERIVEPTEARWQQLIERYPATRGELTIARRCGENLADALTGATDPLQLLFPGGSLEYAEQMYQESPFARFYNSLLGEALAAAVAQLPTGRTLRVLEIGAGTGGTSSYVLPRLPAQRSEYTYTDISAHFLVRAREKFSRYPFITYRTLDIEGDLATQNIAEQQFDIVVAANVLHATADLARTFANVRRLLTPGGLLVMLEMVQPQRFIDISFGLTDGWWKFVDHKLRPNYLLLGREQWLRFLADSGFSTPAALPAAELDVPGITPVQSVVLASVPHSSNQLRSLPSDARNWLVFADTSVGEHFAAALRAHGGTALIVRPGPVFRQIGQQCFEIDPTQPSDYVRLLREAPGGPAFDALAHLWSLNVVGTAYSADQQLALGSALYVTQALANCGATPRLWLITRGAQPGLGEAPDVRQAPLWGFGKAVALEHPELRPISIDLDPAPTADSVQDLLQAVLAAGADHLMLRGGERYVTRLRRRVQPMPTAPAELAISARGTLDNLVLRSAVRHTPGPGEVEIRVHATGLNFKDVLNTLGMYPGDPGQLGGECAGIVVAVGSGVTHLHIGDPVVALAPGCFKTYVVAPAMFVAPKPVNLSFAQAAGLLIANVTADFALRHLGQMKTGERVLIHAAAGGVGLAAVGLAKQAGLEIFATAGSPEKRAFLACLGVQHIYDSRTLDFAAQIQADTHGEGVDLVLNSLAGEFVGQSLALLRDGGRFMEIGKRDHLSAAQADALGRNLAYHVIDWGETARQEPQLIREILETIVASVAAGTIAPPPVRVFSMADAQAAFRYMAQARHIGKVIVIQPNATADSPSPTIRSDASYLISGGLSGLGLLTARRLVERGARHLVVIGRRAPSAATQAVITELEQVGAHITIIQGDIARREDVLRALDAAANPPLRGIFHAAGALDDGAISQQNWSRFQSVLAAKIDGAQLLHELTADMQIDYFVLYSSVASLFGSAGQANHSAANAFLDALAHARHANGLAGVSINWGAWAEVGAAAERGVGERASQNGIGSIPPEQGLAILEQLISQGEPQVGVTPIQWPIFLQRYANRSVPPFFAEFVGALRPSSPIAALAAQPDVLRRLEEAPPQRRRDILLGFVQAEAAYVLALPAAQVDEKTPLSALGLDSLMAVELRNRLGAGLALARPLPATLVFDYPTITAITGYLADEALHLTPPTATKDAPAAATLTDSSGMTNILDELENLSDDEIDRLLAQRAGT